MTRTGEIRENGSESDTEKQNLCSRAAQLHVPSQALAQRARFRCMLLPRLSKWELFPSNSSSKKLKLRKQQVSRWTERREVENSIFNAVALSKTFIGATTGESKKSISPS